MFPQPGAGVFSPGTGGGCKVRLIDSGKPAVRFDLLQTHHSPLCAREAGSLYFLTVLFKARQPEPSIHAGFKALFDALVRNHIEESCFSLEFIKKVESESQVAAYPVITLKHALLATWWLRGGCAVVTWGIACAWWLHGHI
jgi:hypothetical protein